MVYHLKVRPNVRIPFVTGQAEVQGLRNIQDLGVASDGDSLVGSTFLTY